MNKTPPAQPQLSAPPETLNTMEQSHVETGLVPCPFCGGTKQRMQDWSYDDPWFAVQCEGPNCGCSVGSSSDFGHAIDRWNKRVPLISTPSTQPQATSREQKAMFKTPPSQEWLEEHKDDDDIEAGSAGVALPKTEEEIAEIIQQEVWFQLREHGAASSVPNFRPRILAALRQSRPVKEEQIS